MGCDESALLRVNSVPLPVVLVLALALFVRGARDCSIVRVSIVGQIRGRDRWWEERDRLWNSRTEDGEIDWSNRPMPVMTQVALVVVPLRAGLPHATPHLPSPSGVSGNDTERNKKTQKLKTHPKDSKNST